MNYHFYYSHCVQNFIKQNIISNVWPRHKSDYFNNLWDKFAKHNHSRVSVGFGIVDPIDDSDYCLVITTHLEFVGSSSGHIESYEEVYLETIIELDYF